MNNTDSAFAQAIATDQTISQGEFEKRFAKRVVEELTEETDT